MLRSVTNPPFADDNLLFLSRSIRDDFVGSEVLDQPGRERTGG
jgi:hypothetical protein